MSAAANEIDDLDGVALADQDLGEPLPFQDGEIVLDGHPSRVDVQAHQQVGHADRTVKLELFAVQGNVQGRWCGCEATQRCQRTALKLGKSR
jgi:hypothetical protein